MDFSNPKPWLSTAGNRWLAENITPEWVVLEFGSGTSSLWFLPRCKWLFTIEHDMDWHNQVTVAAQRLDHQNMTMYRKNRPYHTEDLMKQLPKDFFDLVLVDGRDRVKCAQASYDRVKPGGYFILDDGQRHYYSAVHGDMKRMEWEQVSVGWPPGGRDDGARSTYVWRRPA